MILLGWVVSSNILFIIVTLVTYHDLLFCFQVKAVNTPVFNQFSQLTEFVWN